MGRSSRSLKSTHDPNADPPAAVLNGSHPYTAIVKAAGDRILLDGADGARKNLFALQIQAGSRFFAFAPFSATVNLMARYRYARNIAMNSARQTGRPSCVDLH